MYTAYYTGVVYTGKVYYSGVIDTADYYYTGVVDTGEELFHRWHTLLTFTINSRKAKKI